MRLALTLFLAIGCSAAVASDKVLLGLPFGQPLDRDILECDRSPQTGDYCAMLQQFRKGASVSSLMLRRPNFANPAPLQLPDWVSIRGLVAVHFDSDAITRIVAPTVGVRQQQTVIDAVTARFGPPVSKVDRTTQNAYGATWNVSTVRWEADGVVATHNCTGIESCSLIISTPEREAADIKALQDRKTKNAL